MRWYNGQCCLSSQYTIMGLKYDVPSWRTFTIGRVIFVTPPLILTLSGQQWEVHDAIGFHILNMYICGLLVLHSHIFTLICKLIKTYLKKKIK